MNLLVTGGAGYIGSVVVAHLLRDGHTVTVLDNLSTGHRDSVPTAAVFVEGDVADSASLVTASAGFDGVLHFAARSLVAESVNAPAGYWVNNLVGTQALLDAVVTAGVPRLVFSSTAAVYGEPADVPITESAAARPTNAYGATKLATDLMLTDYCRAYGLGAVSLRYFNVAGAWQGLGERHATETHLIPIALDVAFGMRSHLDVFGDDYPTPDGTCIRDYVHVADLATAHLCALAGTQPGRHVIYNLGSGRGYSVAEVVNAVRSVTGADVPTKIIARRPGDPSRLIASSDRITADLGWYATRSLTTIVEDAWEFARRRRDRPAST